MAPPSLAGDPIAGDHGLGGMIPPIALGRVRSARLPHWRRAPLARRWAEPCAGAPRPMSTPCSLSQGGAAQSLEPPAGRDATEEVGGPLDSGPGAGSDTLGCSELRRGHMFTLACHMPLPSWSYFARATRGLVCVALGTAHTGTLPSGAFGRRWSTAEVSERTN